VYPITFVEKLSFLPVSFSIGFFKETPMLIPMNIENREPLTSNYSKSGVA